MTSSARALAAMAAEALVIDDVDLMKWALRGDTKAEEALRRRARRGGTAAAILRVLEQSRVTVVQCCEVCGGGTVSALGVCLGCLDRG